jgi:YD repeat-containing protein
MTGEQETTVLVSHPAGCAGCCFPLMPTHPYESPCREQADELVRATAIPAVARRREETAVDVRGSYTRDCLNLADRETFTASLSERTYQYTLFYFDRAGNLVRTVPPKGVDLLTRAEIDQVQRHRLGGGVSAIYTGHTLATEYAYNTFNQLVAKTTPDSGTVRYWYDRLGRQVASQDAKQAATSRTGKHFYSYVVYDPLGRIQERGEVKALRRLAPQDGREALAGDLNARNEASRANWLRNRQRTEHTTIRYDERLNDAVSGYFGPEGQKYLRNRVASMLHFGRGSELSYTHATHFSYDIHGNVRTLMQDNPEMPAGHRAKAVAYEYDLMNGNVTRLLYQPGQPDQFIHHYVYDADKRLISVETSTDGVFWDRDAKYDYYRNVPLARLELGQERVQGGLRVHHPGLAQGVNSESLLPDSESGRDGSCTAGARRPHFAADAYGLALGYYEGDYSAIGLHVPHEDFLATRVGSPIPADALFNGDVSSQAVSFGALGSDQQRQLATYRYDQLSRLRRTDVFKLDAVDRAANTWASARAVDDYRMTLDYDRNGNIARVTRNGLAGPTIPNPAIDDLAYHYRDGTNQLTHIRDSVGRMDEDLPDQPNGNYSYDQNGQLVGDVSEGIHIA